MVFRAKTVAFWANSAVIIANTTVLRAITVTVTTVTTVVFGGKYSCICEEERNVEISRNPSLFQGPNNKVTK